MDITIYLPDELGVWAKQEDLGLSRMLRDAVEAEKRRREAVAAALTDAEVHSLYVRDPDGREFTARVHGTRIASSEDMTTDVYLGKDGKIYVYFGPDERLHRDVPADDLRNSLDDDAYVDAMNALGKDAVIDVGLPEELPLSLSLEIGDGVPLGIKLKGAAGDVITREVHAARERANRDAFTGRLRTYGCIVCGWGFWDPIDLTEGRRPGHRPDGMNTCGSETACIERVSGLNPNIRRHPGKEMPLTNVFTGDSVDTYEQVFAR